MSRTFKVGDRVRVIANPLNPAMVGAETVVTDGPRLGVWPDGRAEEAWEVDLPSAHLGYTRALYPTHHLVPLYDGNQTVAWSDCVWQPRKVAA